jgi:hypothetical protein
MTTLHCIVWQQTLYEDTKALCLALWGGRCAVCGKIAQSPHCHHVFVSQRYNSAHRDLRNVVPVCGQDCHQKAHGRAKHAVRKLLLELIGNGDTRLGLKIIRQAIKDDWDLTKGKIEIE